MRLGLCCHPFYLYLPSWAEDGVPLCGPGVCAYAYVNTECRVSKPVLYCRAFISGLRPCNFLLVCLLHFQLSSAFALKTCSWFDLLCKQAGSFIRSVCPVSGTSCKKLSKLYRYLPEKHTFLSPLFLSVHEGTVHGTDLLPAASFAAAPGVVRVYSRGCHVRYERWNVTLCR